MANPELYIEYEYVFGTKKDPHGKIKLKMGLPDLSADERKRKFTEGKAMLDAWKIDLGLKKVNSQNYEKFDNQPSKEEVIERLRVRGFYCEGGDPDPLVSYSYSFGTKRDPHGRLVLHMGLPDLSHEERERRYISGKALLDAWKIELGHIKVGRSYPGPFTKQPSKEEVIKKLLDNGYYSKGNVRGTVDRRESFEEDRFNIIQTAINTHGQIYFFGIDGSNALLSRTIVRWIRKLATDDGLLNTQQAERARLVGMGMDLKKYTTDRTTYYKAVYDLLIKSNPKLDVSKYKPPPPPYEDTRHGYSVFSPTREGLFGNRGNPVRETAYHVHDHVWKTNAAEVLISRKFLLDKHEKNSKDPALMITPIQFLDTNNDALLVTKEEIDWVSPSFLFSQVLEMLYKKADLHKEKFPLVWPVLPHFGQSEDPLVMEDERMFHNLCCKLYKKCLRRCCPDARSVNVFRGMVARLVSEGGRRRVEGERTYDRIGYNRILSMSTEHGDKFQGLLRQAAMTSRPESMLPKIEMDHALAIARWQFLMDFAKEHKGRGHPMASNPQLVKDKIFQIDKNILFLPWFMNRIKTKNVIFNIFVLFSEDGLDVTLKFRCIDGRYLTAMELLVDKTYTNHDLMNLHSDKPILAMYFGNNVPQARLLCTSIKKGNEIHASMKGIIHYSTYPAYLVSLGKTETELAKLRSLKPHRDYPHEDAEIDEEDDDPENED